MVRVFLLASLFALLALGTAAYAECTSCFTSVFADRSGTNIQLTFTASTNSGATLPDEVIAVVMQVDGNRTKCLNVALHKDSEIKGFAVYNGSFSAYGTYSHSGRVELGSQIYEFSVPLDGTAGKVDIASDQSPLNRNGLRLQVTAAPVTPAPTVAPAPPTPLELPKIEPAFLIGGAVVLVTIIGAYVDRRRSLARSLTA
jgi:hypothetical protein